MLQRVILKAVVLSFFYGVNGIVINVAKLSTKCKETPQPPENAVCNTRGRIQGYQISYGNYDLGAKLLSSVEECLDLCLKRKPNTRDLDLYTCHSVAYNETSQACLLSIYELRGKYGVKYGAKFKADPTSDTIFWSSDCFECPNYCPQKNVSFADIDRRSKAANLLDNGSFDDSTEIPLSGPWFFPSKNLAEQQLISRSRSSTYLSRAFKFHSIKPRSLYSFPGQAYPACLGQRYLLKFDWKLSISNLHHPTLALVGLENIYDSYTWHFRISSNPHNADPIVGHWVTSEISFLEEYEGEALGQPTTAVFYMDSVYQDEAKGYSFLDNLGVYPISSPINTKAETELVRNRDLETGNPKQSRNITTRLNRRYVVSANYYYTEPCSLDYNPLEFLLISKYGTEYSWFAGILQGRSNTFENIFRSLRTEYTLTIEYYGDCPLYVGNISVREAA